MAVRRRRWEVRSDTAPLLVRVVWGVRRSSAVLTTASMFRTTPKIAGKCYYIGVTWSFPRMPRAYFGYARGTVATSAAARAKTRPPSQKLADLSATFHHPAIS